MGAAPLMPVLLAEALLTVVVPAEGDNRGDVGLVLTILEMVQDPMEMTHLDSGGLSSSLKTFSP